jgi:hypothetical protein
MLSLNAGIRRVEPFRATGGNNLPLFFHPAPRRDRRPQGGCRLTPARAAGVLREFVDTACAENMCIMEEPIAAEQLLMFPIRFRLFVSQHRCP